MKSIASAIPRYSFIAVCALFAASSLISCSVHQPKYSDIYIDSIFFDSPVDSLLHERVIDARQLDKSTALHDAKGCDAVGASKQSGAHARHLTNCTCYPLRGR